MKRTPEPELMDADEQAEAYAAADFTTSDAAFVSAFVDRFGADVDGPIADLGCGPGNIALRLLDVLADVHVVAIDGSEAMLRLARRQIDALPPGKRARIELRQALVPDPSLPTAHFGAVVSNSLLHHLHEPAGLWSAVRQIARPGAPVFIGDLRRPPDPAEVDRIVATYAADDPDVLRRDFRASLHAAFEPAEIAEQLERAGLGDWSVEPIGDRHVYVAGRVPA